MKKIIYALVIVICLGWLIAATKDTVAKMVVEKAVSSATGLKLSMKSFSLGVLNSDLAIEDLQLLNPAGYKDRQMLYVPRIFVDYNFADLIKRTVHIENMELDLKELLVVKNKDGAYNVSSLKPMQKKETAPKEPVKKEKEGAAEFRIDNLALKIGKVVYKDYSKNADDPAIQEFTLNFSGKYSNITDLRSLVKLIVGKALLGTALGNIANLDFEGVKSAAESVTSSAKETAGSAADSVKQTLGGILNPQ